MRTFFRTLRWRFQRRQRDDDLREELEFHLDEEAAERQADGLPDDQARRAARLHLGNLAIVEERVRAEWGWTWIEQLIQDVRYASRAMLRNRAFTLLTILSLALGIGANTAIYSFMDAVLMRSLPVKDPGSLVVVNWRSRDATRDAQGNREFVMHSMSGSVNGDAEGGLRSGIFPYPAFELLQKQSSSVFSSVFAYYPNRGANLLIDGQAYTGRGEYVSGEFFRGLEVRPAAGRLLVGDDDRVGAPPVLVISFAFSERHFGQADRAPGRSILINAIPFTIVGVTPPDFFGVDPAAAPEFYLPLHANLLVDAAGLNGVTKDQYLAQDYYWLEMMARLRPGVSLDDAQTVLAPQFRQWVSTTAVTPAERANLPSLSLAEGAGGLDNLRRTYSKPLFILLMLVGMILLLACANTANLLLARAAARRREMAVRLSIGAGRLRVVRQLLTESVLLASLGGLAGVLLALWGIRFLTLLLASGQEPFTLNAEMNWRVLLATLVVSVLSGTLFGLAPALQSTRPDVMPALKDIRGEASRGRRRGFRGLSLSRVLVVAQVAMSLLLLVTAALFVRTLANLHAVELGFNQQNVLLFDVNARQAGHQDPEIADFYGALRRSLTGIPGVQSATLARASIISAGTQLPIFVSGKEARGTRFLNVGPSFFTTMQIPLLLGREIDERDRPHTAPVAVVNERFATLHFGGSNAIGRHITLGGPTTRDMEIVGVSGNVRYQGLREELVPVVFVAYDQGDYPPLEEMTFALRTTGNPLAYASTVRELIHKADLRVPVTNLKTQDGEIEETINQEIIFARLCTGFALIALVIASVGLYGTTSYGVARRTSEIGIRMALGARRGKVVLMVLREVVLLAAAGLAIGVPMALAVSRLVESFLFGLKPTDPAALLLSVVILALAAAVAGYVPAHRASRIEPTTALRHE
jgi:predicted permease